MKGGVGKTTMTINLAESFYKRGKKVLIIDLDWCAGASTRYLKEGEVCFRREFQRGLFNDEVGIYNTNKEGIDIVPADYFFRNYLDIKTHEGNVDFAYGLIDRNRNDYDIIICDSPSLISYSMGGWPLAVSDTLLIPVDGDMALRQSLSLMAHIGIVIESSENVLEFVGVVQTKFNPRFRTHRSLKERIEQEYGLNSMDTTIPVDTNVSKECSLKKGVVEHAPNSRAAIAYSDLADELIERWNNRRGLVWRSLNADLRISAESYSQIEKIEKECGISMSAAIRLMIENGLESEN